MFSELCSKIRRVLPFPLHHASSSRAQLDLSHLVLSEGSYPRGQEVWVPFIRLHESILMGFLLGHLFLLTAFKQESLKSQMW